MRYIKSIGIGALFILFSVRLMAQNDARIDTAIRRNALRAVPFIFYSPDTRWGFGAGGYYSFFTSKNLKYTRPSTFIIGFSYTQNKQLLFYLPFSLNFEKSKLWVNGELGYYKYIFNYFGIGNNVPDKFIEKYSADFPRLRLNALFQILPKHYLGLRYAFDEFTYTKFDTSGLLFNQDILGTENSNISSVGLVYNIDRRDIINYPTKGFIVELSYTIDDKYTGSDFMFRKLSLDYSFYKTFKEKLTTVINASFVQIDGATPFHQLATFGGTKKLRGYFDGKYRDRNSLLVQTELRFKIYKRIEFAAFGGLGKIYNLSNELNYNNLRYNYGLGLRYQMDKVSKIHLRVDYGFGNKSSGFYLTIGEAF